MTASKLLHVLGGGPWQLPTVALAKQLGYRVLVTDMYEERPAYAIADCHEQVSIADPEATLGVARRYGIHGIICDTTDVGVPTAAYVAEALGLPGIGLEAALNCTRKDRMRFRTQEAGCRVPRWATAASLSELEARAAELGFPLMVKPVDNQSGRGVTRVARTADLAKAFDSAKRHTRESRVLVEICIQGVEIIVDGFVVDGAPTMLAIAEKTPYPDNPTISSRITYPATLLPSSRAALEVENTRVLNALGLEQGVFHAEYLICAEGFIPIDVAARGGGVMIYTHVVPFVSGVDVNRAQLDFVAGNPVRIAPSGTSRAANIEFIRLPEGRLITIEGADLAARSPNVIGMHLNLAPGDIIGPLEKKDDRPGYLIGTGTTAAEAIAASIGAKAALRAVIHETPYSVLID